MASMASIKDWLKLLFIGGFFESCRRLFTWAYSSVMEGFYMRASFDSNDPSYGTSLVFDAAYHKLYPASH